MEKEECVFCAIVNKKIPAKIVCEDENFLAFLDIRPLNPGNSLLIPKQHCRWVYDVPNFGEYWEAAKKIGLATMKALGAFSISYATLGFEVQHAHIRIIPRFENDGHAGFIDWSNVKQISEEEMEKIAEKIQAVVEEMKKSEKPVEEVKEEVKEEKPRTEEEIKWIKRQTELT